LSALSFKVLSTFSDTTIELADFLEAAEPTLFVFEPFILSDLGAGVCAADFLPTLFAIIKFLPNLFVFNEKKVFLNAEHIIYTKNKQKMDFLNIKSANFLGGSNVHNVIKIALAGFIAYKLYKK
jgi:hypothetical protein